MEIKSFRYYKRFGLPNYSSEEIGFEIQLEPGEDVETAVQEAMQITEKLHRDNNPGLYLTNRATNQPSMADNVQQPVDTTKTLAVKPQKNQPETAAKMKPDEHTRNMWLKAKLAKNHTKVEKLEMIYDFNEPVGEKKEVTDAS